MNVQRLKEAEAKFLLRYPKGFADPDMEAVVKKHRMVKMVEQTRDLFREANFARPQTVVDNLVKTVSQSSMVSVFEKPKFRDFCRSLTVEERELLAGGLEAQLHGSQQAGFEMMLDLLKARKLAKWTLMTITPLYFRPEQEVFVKPNTVKAIIKSLELPNLEYKPTPSWEFYSEFRRQVMEMKTLVDPSISTNNAGFTGFLMMTL